MKKLAKSIDWATRLAESDRRSALGTDDSQRHHTVVVSSLVWLALDNCGWNGLSF